MILACIGNMVGCICEFDEMYIVDRLLQSLKASDSIFFTDAGIVIVFRFVHFANTLFPIDCRCFPSTIVSNEVHPKKRLLCSSRTPSGIVIALRDVQYANAHLSIVLIDLGNSIVDKLVHPENAAYPIDDIPLLMITVVNDLLSINAEKWIETTLYILSFIVIVDCNSIVVNG